MSVQQSVSVMCYRHLSLRQFVTFMCNLHDSVRLFVLVMCSRHFSLRQFVTFMCNLPESVRLFVLEMYYKHFFSDSLLHLFVIYTTLSDCLSRSYAVYRMVVWSTVIRWLSLYRRQTWFSGLGSAARALLTSIWCRSWKIFNVFYHNCSVIDSNGCAV